MVRIWPKVTITHGSGSHGRSAVLGHHLHVRRHPGVGRIAVQRAGDRVRPDREVAAQAGRHLAVQAQRRGQDLLRVGDAQLLEALGEVHAARGVAVRDHEVRAGGAGARQRSDQVGLALVVADLLDLDPDLLQRVRDRGRALGDARDVRVYERRGLGVEDLLGVRSERAEHVGGVAEQDHVARLGPVERGHGHAHDHRLGRADRRLERLDRRSPPRPHRSPRWTCLPGIAGHRSCLPPRPTG